jgi:hypothetical protein
MKIGKRIKICGHWIAVRVYKKNPFAVIRGAKQIGGADSLCNRITILTKVDNEPLAESVIAESYFHEILHQCANKNGINLKESEVIILSQSMFATIRDNHINFLDES